MLAKMLNSLKDMQKWAALAYLCLGIALPMNSLAAGKTKAKAESPEWSGSFTNLNYTNTIQNNYEDVHASGSYVLGLKRTLPSINSTIGISGGYILEYTHKSEDSGRNGDWTEPLLSYRYKFGDRGVFKKVILGMDAVAPLSRSARSRSMIAAIGPIVGWGFDFGQLSLTQRLGYMYAAFTYDTSLDSKMNTPNTVYLSNNLELKISKALSAGIAFAFVSASDYEGIVSTSTATAGSIGWMIAKNFSTSLGVATTAGTLTPMGNYHRVNLYDVNKANAFLELTLTF